MLKNNMRTICGEYGRYSPQTGSPAVLRLFPRTEEPPNKGFLRVSDYNTYEKENGFARPWSDCYHWHMQVKRDETRSVWHPIETSPRDETAFIAYSRRARAYGPNNGMVIAFWSDADFLEALTGEKLDEALYIHWSPLPHKPHCRGK